jgi:TatD DNase family protein
MGLAARRESAGSTWRLAGANVSPAMANLFDTHAHLDDPCFRSELPALLERARSAGVTRIICVGTDLESSERAIRLSEEHPGLHAAVGWHPNHALEAPADLRPALLKLAAHPKVVAIGETGLDYYRLPSTKGGTPEQDEHFKRRQAEIFVQQLEVAATAGLNCIIHQRGDVFEDTLTRLAPWAGKVRAVFHCFSGEAPALERIRALGGLVSYTGILTFKNGQNVRDALTATPLDGFMLETDAPYLAPLPHRGRRCAPAHLLETARVAAAVKGVTLDELAAATCATAREFFKRMD